MTVTQQKQPVDCRKCVHAKITVAEGGCIRCGYYNNTRVSALLAKSPDYPCSAFTPVAPASPPVSADREGPDALDALREARDVLLLSDPVGVRAHAIAGLPEDRDVAELCERWGHGAVMDSAARQWRRIDSIAAQTTGAAAGTVQKTLATVDAALAAEEARRARPAVEDPRDALLAKCATAVRDAAAIARSAKVLAVAGGHSASERVYTTAEVEFEALGAALRAAGVEPAQ